MKNIIKKSLQALLFVPAMALAVSAVSPALTAPVGAVGISDGANSAKGDEQTEDLTGSGGAFTQITNVLLFIIGAISVIMLIVGGIRYTVSGGDSGQITAAKNTILYAIVGIVVAILAYAIVNFFIGQFSSGA